MLHADRPAVLEVLTDPNISMLPPHIEPAQMKAFASALLHGDPDEKPMFVQSVKGVLAGHVPGQARAAETVSGAATGRRARFRSSGWR